MRRFQFYAVTFLFLLAMPLSVAAEQVQSFGDIEVHYNAMPTSDLMPEVARAYKIPRSQNRGLITIAVFRKNPVGVAVPVKAATKAYVVNLNGQLANVAMREIREGSALYYLGEFRVTPPDTLKINVAVKTAKEAEQFEFQKEFFP